MKVNLSLLSKNRSFIGFEIEHGGYLKKNEEGYPVLVRAIEFSFGFLFGWLVISFDTGREIKLDEINKSLREEVMGGKIIDANK
jgi:hypothetical protein